MSFPNPDTLFRQLLPYFLSRDEFSQIAQTTLTGSVASVIFLGIPQTFRTLQLIHAARSDRVAEIDNVNLIFNADSGANYDRQLIRGNDVAITSNGARALNSLVVGFAEAANSRANNFSPGNTIIYDYAETDREKWLTTTFGVMGNVSADADMNLQIEIERWRSTAAITSITLTPNVGPNFVSGSVFQLYGLQ